MNDLFEVAKRASQKWKVVLKAAGAAADWSWRCNKNKHTGINKNMDCVWSKGRERNKKTLANLKGDLCLEKRKERKREEISREEVKVIKGKSNWKKKKKEEEKIRRMFGVFSKSFVGCATNSLTVVPAMNFGANLK